MSRVPSGKCDATNTYCFTTTSTGGKKYAAHHNKDDNPTHCSGHMSNPPATLGHSVSCRLRNDSRCPGYLERDLVPGAGGGVV